MKLHKSSSFGLYPIVLALLVSVFGSSGRCADKEKKDAAPSIELRNVPSIPPGEDGNGPIDGKASADNLKDCKVVLYARGDKWYVQPFADSPDTSIRSDGTFENTTHGGFEYAALLVKNSYRAPATLTRLPAIGGDILAKSTMKPKSAK